jgi:hypothetical protein
MLPSSDARQMFDFHYQINTLAYTPVKVCMLSLKNHLKNISIWQNRVLWTIRRSCTSFVSWASVPLLVPHSY